MCDTAEIPGQQWDTLEWLQHDLEQVGNTGEILTLVAVWDIPCSPTPVLPTLDQKVAFRLFIKNSSM